MVNFYWTTDIEEAKREQNTLVNLVETSKSVFDLEKFKTGLAIGTAYEENTKTAFAVCAKFDRNGSIISDYYQIRKEVGIMQYEDLEQTLDSLRNTNPRNAAEYAYVLAMLYKQAGDNKKAVQFGQESIILFNECNMDTMEDCAARNVVIEGVALPDLIHQDVVRDRLKPLAL